ncbi:MAG: hypothetical protein V7K55_05320 [Nostoc sp.]
MNLATDLRKKRYFLYEMLRKRRVTPMYPQMSRVQEAERSLV